MDAANKSEEHAENKNDEKIDIKTVRDIHDEQLLNGHNNNDKTLKIVAALGGIDDILSACLQQKNQKMTVKMTQTTLHRIEQILTTQYKHHNKATLNPLSVINQDQNEEGNNLEYVFSANDTILSRICGISKAEKIINALYSKTSLIVLVLSLLIVSGLFSSDNPMAKLLSILINGFIIIPWFLFAIFSANKIAFNLLLRSFEWWLKAAYSLYFGVLGVIYLGQKEGYMDIVTIYGVFGAVHIVLASMFIGSFDALYHVGKGWKTSISAMAAFMFLFISINYQFLLPESEDVIIKVPVTQSILSSHSLAASSARILSIFFSKQAIMSYIRKNRCILIKYSPFIKWKKEEKKKYVGNIGNNETEKKIAEIVEENGVKMGDIKTMRIGMNENNESISIHCDDIEDDDD